MDSFCQRTLIQLNIQGSASKLDIFSYWKKQSSKKECHKIKVRTVVNKIFQSFIMSLYMDNGSKSSCYERMTEFVGSTPGYVIFS